MQPGGGPVPITVDPAAISKAAAGAIGASVTAADAAGNDTQAGGAQLPKIVHPGPGLTQLGASPTKGVA